jgi:hypothetical protein
MNILLSFLIYLGQAKKEGLVWLIIPLSVILDLYALKPIGSTGLVMLLGLVFFNLVLGDLFKRKKKFRF